MNDELMAAALEAQYRAALQMLGKAMTKTPAGEWNGPEQQTPVWQLAYHTLWATKFYLTASPETFAPWADAIPGAESLGGTEEWENPEPGLQPEGFHTKPELQRYLEDILNQLSEQVRGLPFSEHSGFEWYPFSRLELHLNNLRHIQHHTAQIIERLKQKGIFGFPWPIAGHNRGGGRATSRYERK
ncbi:hypothetical protein C7T94_06235 [Pedobacter yulinensis]|uniref:DinB-like domain-containing protein n=1 Tax=Pedobacter yulinensis TaxID=2126353 RepID=A0A2T3HPJ8_9SPHI|nr:DinB family protein [Pedobacter yulinensis]PST84311.1 hypothetical protein C7T94_06235 [Pedobacter yulinensis]